MTVPLRALPKCNTWRRATTLLPILLFTTLANAQSYEFRDLGAIGGDTNSYGSQPYGINSSGEVVGTSAVPGGSQHAFLWSGSNGMKDLGSLGGSLSVAFGINASSGIAGWSTRTSGASHHAFYWTQTTGMRDLGTLGGSFSEATGINDSNVIAGFSATVSGVTHGFVWTAKKGMVDIGTLIGNKGNSDAYAINSSGEVVGQSSASNGEHAFFWTQGTGIQDMGTLGGLTSQANGINDLGQVVGAASVVSGAYHAFSWTHSGGMQDLGSLDGSSGLSLAYSVNASGEIVGWTGSGGTTHAFVWTQTSGMQDLNTLIPTSCGCNIVVGAAINGNGQIAAFGYNSKNEAHAFLLTPISK